MRTQFKVRIGLISLLAGYIGLCTQEGRTAPFAESSVSEYVGRIAPSRTIGQEVMYDPNFLSFFFLGITAKNEALYLRNHVDSGVFYWCDLKSGRVLRSKETTTFNFIKLRLSSDGRSLFTTYNTNTLDMHNFYLRKLLVVDAETLNFKERIVVHPKTNIFFSASLPRKPQLIAFSTLQFTWDAHEKDYVANAKRGTRLEVWNLATGKQQSSFLYPSAPGTSDISFSPDAGNKWVAFVFKEKNEFDQGFDNSGILDILNSRTGEILWHIQSDAQHPVNLPFAFVGANQLMMRNALYDIPSKRVTLLFPASDRRLRFVGGVPGHNGKVMLLTKQGLELWDWARQVPLHRWPAIHQVDGVTFSPDLTRMLTEVSNSEVRGIWKFNPKWL